MPTPIENNKTPFYMGLQTCAFLFVNNLQITNQMQIIIRFHSKYTILKFLIYLLVRPFEYAVFVCRHSVFVCRHSVFVCRHSVFVSSFLNP